MSGWTKLFGSIVTSSIWCEDDKTLRAWIAMLATCDAAGIVQGSIPGFANLCRMSIQEMESAVKTLSEPDPYSRTPDNEGRRIEKAKGGWRILNYEDYRNRGQEKDGSNAKYARAYRNRKSLTQSNALDSELTRHTEAEAEAEAEAYLTTFGLKESQKTTSSSCIDDDGAKGRKRSRKVKLDPLRSEDRVWFERAWSEWPARNDGKPSRGNRIVAENLWATILACKVATAEELYRAALKYKSHPNVEAGYIKHVRTFFAIEDGEWKAAIRMIREEGNNEITA